MVIPKSIVRLAQVVTECGRPEPVTLWSDPKKDPDFDAAVQRNRVMTVIQETVGTKKDFGVVGFHRVEHASYLVFPKLLDAFEGKRVIGINYDLLNVPKPKDSVKLTPEPAKKVPPKHLAKPIEEPTKKQPTTPPPEKAKPSLHRFRVTIRSVATVENDREVEARTAKEAGETALGMAANKTGAFPDGNVSRKVVRVRRF